MSNLSHRPKPTKTVDVRSIHPMLATLLEEPPASEDWIFEPKFDGLRLLASFDGKKLEMMSRNAKSQMSFFPDIAVALKKSLRRPIVVDGEVVCSAFGYQIEIAKMIFEVFNEILFIFPAIIATGNEVQMHTPLFRKC